jgi:hypothetical protein
VGGLGAGLAGFVAPEAIAGTCLVGGLGLMFKGGSPEAFLLGIGVVLVVTPVVYVVGNVARPFLAVGGAVAGFLGGAYAGAKEGLVNGMTTVLTDLKDYGRRASQSLAKIKTLF